MMFAWTPDDYSDLDGRVIIDGPRGDTITDMSPEDARAFAQAILDAAQQAETHSEWLTQQDTPLLTGVPDHSRAGIAQLCQSVCRQGDDAREDAMTDWQPFVEADVEPVGKVTGRARAIFYGENRANVMTGSTSDYSVIHYRDREWTVNVAFTLDDEGRVTEDTTKTNSVNEAGTWGRKTPRTFRAAIVSHLAGALSRVWTDELDKAGLQSMVAQRLNRLEANVTDKRAELTALEDEIDAQLAKLANAGLPMPARVS